MAKRHVTKYSLAEVEAAREFIKQALKVSPPTSYGHLALAAYYLQATINQRTKSTGPRAKGGKPKGEA